MGRLVEVTAGQRGLALPDGRIYSAGEQATLSNAHYAEVPIGWVGPLLTDLGPVAEPPLGPDEETPVDAAAGVPSLRTLGAGATQAAAGTHAHASGQIRRTVVVVTGGTAGGNTNPNTAGAWAPLAGVGEITIAAAAGDYVECAVAMLTTADTGTFYDLAVVKAAALVWYGSTRTGSQPSANEGDPAIYPTLNSRGAPFAALDVTSAELSVDNLVHFVLAIRSGGAGKTYYSTSYPLRWRAINYGPPS